MLFVALAGLLLEPEGFSIPEARYFGGQAAIAVEGEPGKKTWLMLDSGAEKSVCNGKLAKDGSPVAFQLGKQKMKIPTERDETFPGSTEADGSVISGVVGCDFLQRTQFLLAPATGKLWLRPASHLSPSDAEKALREVEPKAKTSTLAVLPLKLTEDGYFAAGRVGTKPVQWIFDTGSSLMSMGKKEAVADGARPIGSRTISDYAGTGTSSCWLLPSVDVGPKHFQFPSVADEGAEEGEDENVVSSLDLARTVLVDLPGKTVYWLEPTDEAAKIDSVIGRLLSMPVHRLSSGDLAIDAEMALGHPMDEKVFPIIVSVQGVSFADLRTLITSAIAGEPKAFDRLTELYRAELKAPQIMASILGETRPFGKPR